jgi:hypothetical protein
MQTERLDRFKFLSPTFKFKIHLNTVKKQMEKALLLESFFDVFDKN